VKKRVVIGLSGGVDSSVAGFILKSQGYDVTALFMRNWNDTTGLIQGECHWEDDLMFAEMVARKLNIPLHLVDLSVPYRERVVDYMFNEYGKGRTPNPDVLCNREIKFDSFAVEAQKLGADYVATGHYCRKEMTGTDNEPVFRLLSGVDRNKDQSYFLCQVSQEQLRFSLFPIGGLTKPEVRRIAEEQGLATAARKDSQGICFVGKVHLPSFLQQQLAAREGDVVEMPADFFRQDQSAGLPGADATDSQLATCTHPHSFDPSAGKKIGRHHGAHFFTTGQRKGINIGGYTEPLYVLASDVEQNILFVGEGDSHPGLYRKGLRIREDEIHWIRTDLKMDEGERREYMVRIRYRQPLQKAALFRRSGGLFIVFDQLQRGIAPGQFAAWYDGEELLGSGVIDR
jgi:tRNA-specific 2-thiouridylase